MVNEAMPWQLTVRELKRVLGEAQDGAAVVLVVPKGGIGHPDLVTFQNLKVRSDGTVVSLIPLGDSDVESR